MKNITEDIRNRNFRRAYLLYGNEEFLKRSLKNQLRSAIAGDDTMNLMMLGGKDISLDTVRDFTDTMPFFADKRLLILEDTGLFKSSSEGFDVWLEHLPETACVVFSESETDKRNRLFKKISEVGYAAELNHPDEKALKNWILKQIKSRGMNITNDAYEKFLLCIGEDMDDTRNELEKLMSYCQDTGVITAEDVGRICTVKLKNRIFELVTLASEGREKEALDLYYDLLFLRESPLRILFLLTRQLNQFVTVQRMLKEGKSSADIAGALGLKSFIAGKVMNQARKLSAARTQALVKLSLETEEAVKSGDLQEQIACEMFLLRMTERKV